MFYNNSLKSEVKQNSFSKLLLRYEKPFENRNISLFFPSLKDLDVRFGEGQRLRQDFDNVKVLHLKPFAGT
jgi:hypothetical protein